MPDFVACLFAAAAAINTAGLLSELLVLLAIVSADRGYNAKYKLTIMTRLVNANIVNVMRSITSSSIWTHHRTMVPPMLINTSGTAQVNACTKQPIALRS